jgi:predicted RNA-binding protein YlxR (DUF448 family)
MGEDLRSTSLEKHSPPPAGRVWRKCVGCFQDHLAESMHRVGRLANGEIVVEPVGRSGSRPGRGAYVCPEKGCIEKAFRRKGKRTPLSHWLKIPLNEVQLDQINVSVSKHLS